VRPITGNRPIGGRQTQFESGGGSTSDGQKPAAHLIYSPNWFTLSQTGGKQV